MNYANPTLDGKMRKNVISFQISTKSKQSLVVGLPNCHSSPVACVAGTHDTFRHICSAFSAGFGTLGHTVAMDRGNRPLPESLAVTSRWCCGE